MKKSYKIEVDCANCAQKMEDAANTVAGVAKATVSFMTQKMNVEFDEARTSRLPCRTSSPPARRSRTTARSSASEFRLLLPGCAWKMWKNKSVFNNFHGVFNILGAKKEK